jgi:hypothetical protein
LRTADTTKSATPADDDDDDDEDITITMLVAGHIEKDVVGEYLDSSPPPPITRTPLILRVMRAQLTLLQEMPIYALG